jgi:hypothetical protein
MVLDSLILAGSTVLEETVSVLNLAVTTVLILAAAEASTVLGAILKILTTIALKILKDSSK